MRLLEKSKKITNVDANEMLSQLEDIISPFLTSITFIDMPPNCKSIYNFYTHQIIK